jgi:hypothetical protein
MGGKKEHALPVAPAARGKPDFILDTNSSWPLDHFVALL